MATYKRKKVDTPKKSLAFTLFTSVPRITQYIWSRFNRTDRDNMQDADPSLSRETVTQLEKDRLSSVTPKRLEKILFKKGNATLGMYETTVKVHQVWLVSDGRSLLILGTLSHATLDNSCLDLHSLTGKRAVHVLGRNLKDVTGWDVHCPEVRANQSIILCPAEAQEHTEVVILDANNLATKITVKLLGKFRREMPRCFSLYWPAELHDHQLNQRVPREVLQCSR